jgi:hypothetical protein
MKKDETGLACGMYGKRKLRTEFFWANLKAGNDGQLKESSRSGSGLQLPQ